MQEGIACSAKRGFSAKTESQNHCAMPGRFPALGVPNLHAKAAFRVSISLGAEETAAYLVTLGNIRLNQKAPRAQSATLVGMESEIS
jgi:hypothetical protein